MKLSYHTPYNQHEYILVNGKYRVPTILAFWTFFPPFAIAFGFAIPFFTTGTFWMIIPAIVVGTILVLIFITALISAWVNVFRSGHGYGGRG